MLSKETVELVGKATALAAFLFTAFTYAHGLRRDRAEARYTASVDLMGRYRGDEIRAAESALAQHMLYYQDVDLDPNDPNDYPDSQFDAIAKEVLFGDIGVEGGRGMSFLPQLLQISDFYSEVAFCLASDICAPEILERYFCPRATVFYERNRRLLAYYVGYSVSETWIDGLEALVESCKI